MVVWVGHALDALWRLAAPVSLTEEEARQNAGKGREKDNEPEDRRWGKDLHKQVVDSL